MSSWKVGAGRHGIRRGQTRRRAERYHQAQKKSPQCGNRPDGFRAQLRVLSLNPGLGGKADVPPAFALLSACFENVAAARAIDIPFPPENTGAFEPPD
jgi:hypothetical protein